MKEYENIVEDIKKKIINGTLVAGDKLPSIKDMTKIYQVSSITVRNSLSILTNEGYIYTKERSGCFVKKSENDKFFLNFNEFTNIKDPILSIKTMGVSQIFDFNEINNNQNKNLQTIKLRRIFNSYLDAPIAYDVKYLIHHFKGNVTKFFLNNTFEQLNKYLEKELAKTLEIRIITPTQEIMNALKVSDDIPVFYFKQKYFNANKQLILVGKTYAIADSVQITASSKLLD